MAKVRQLTYQGVIAITVRPNDEILKPSITPEARRFAVDPEITIEEAMAAQDKAARWAKIKLIGLDVDGVLTDGGLTFDEDGRLLQTFNVRDGFGLVAARRSGLTVAWISGRPSKVAERRFKELDLQHCILACADKAAAIRGLQRQLNIRPDECCFVGDDLPDLPAFTTVGLKIAVADAVKEVKERADYVTEANGGRGAVREVVEIILAAQGKWMALLDQFTQVDETQSAVENLQR